MSQARALGKEVAAAPPIKAIKRSMRRFGRKASSPKAKEELIVAVACKESTRTQGVTLKANKTKAESARCHAVLVQARSSVSAASWKSAPSRKTHQVLHHR